MINSILKTFSIFLIVCFLQTILFSKNSEALFLPEGIDEEFSVEIDPETPAPRETIKMDIAGYLSNFDFANIQS